jgi:hypothetical protein
LHHGVHLHHVELWTHARAHPPTIPPTSRIEQVVSSTSATTTEQVVSASSKRVARVVVEGVTSVIVGERVIPSTLIRQRVPSHIGAIIEKIITSTPHSIPIAASTHIPTIIVERVVSRTLTIVHEGVTTTVVVVVEWIASGVLGVVPEWVGIGSSVVCAGVVVVAIGVVSIGGVVPIIAAV